MYGRYEKICSYILMGIMAVSLLVLMYLGLYNHPTGDDYYYAVATKRALEETGNIWSVLAAAVQGVADQYVIWQGTYSAMFFMHLPPNLFGENAYKLVTTMILSLYTGGVFYLFKPILCNVLKGSKHMWWAVSAAFVLLTIQTVPFKGESFFWYNGSMYYTGYLAITFFFFGAMCRYLLSGKKFYLPILMFLAVFLAGGNYVSLLPAVLATAAIGDALFRRRSKKAGWIALIMVFMLAGLAVSALAPGNQVRGEGSVGNMPAIKAIALSLWQSVSYLEAWINRWWLMVVIVLTPFFWQSYKKIAFQFPMPLFVVGFVHGVFCSMSCPTFYAQGSTGPARVMAIVYYGFMLSSLVNYYYLLGYFYRWCQCRIAWKENSGDNSKGLKRYTPGFLAAGLMIFLLGAQIYSGELAQCSSVQAIRVLANGEAAAYEQEYKERLSVLEDDGVRDVVFTPYEHQPAMIYVGDFTADVTNENNVEIAKYFHKDTIKVDLLD